ncbi:MAG: carbonic anhydrase [Gemmatimonadales bacterium]
MNEDALLARLFANNRAWSDAHKREDPEFFERLCAIQAPEYLWIGCADSRVPANEIVGLAPGELFVHRNVANVVAPDDPNAQSVIQYAVDTLRVRHIIVTGHYGCGGVLAAMGPAMQAPLESWLERVRGVAREHAGELAELGARDDRWRRLCELNVVAQVRAVCSSATVGAAWKRRQPLVVHGWIYDLHDGLLRDLGVSMTGQPLD